MKQEHYEGIFRWFRAEKWRVKTLLFLTKGLPYLFFLGYGGMLLFLLLKRDLRLAAAIVVPGLTLLLCMRMRVILNRKRPYEALQIAPLLQKDTAGKSCPSNHTTSAFVIAATAFWLFGWGVGVGAFLLAGMVGLTRVLTGVHFPRDVILGAALGILVAAIGYFLL